MLRWRRQREVVNAAAVQVLAMIMTSASAFVLTWRYVDDGLCLVCYVRQNSQRECRHHCTARQRGGRPQLSIWGPNLSQLAPSPKLCNYIRRRICHAARVSSVPF